MKNPFNRTGFDTLIGANAKIDGHLHLGVGTTIIDGILVGPWVGAADQSAEKICSTLVVNGSVGVTGNVISENVTVTGSLRCDILIVEGLLSIKAGALINAREIRYRELHIESGAVVMAQMNHLDHISAGEIT